MPKLSFLIPAFNHEDFIKQCINSILTQNYKNLEIIVVDDCSSDKTAERIKEIKDERLIFIQNSFNRGLNGNLNVAYKKATGDFISIIGSDDYFDQNYISSFIDFIKNNGDNFTVFYPQIVHIDDFCNLSQNQPHFPENKTNEDILKNLFLHGNFLGSPGMIMSKNSAKHIFPLDEGIHQHQDYIMHIQLLFLGKPAFMENVKVFYRIPTDTNGHMSSNCVKANKRVEIETPFAQNYFIKNIKTPQQLTAIFGEMATKYGEPKKETIAYFLARIALDASHNRFLPVWGFRTLIEFLSQNGNQELLYKLYGFEYKDFSALFGKVKLLDDFLHAQEKEFYSSTSWKITKPLRFLKNLFSKKRKNSK